MTVEYIKHGGKERSYKVFCSLTSDRQEGGYRVTAQVLSNAQLRAQMLEDARDEMRTFQQKYHALTELAEVFKAMRRSMK